MKKGPDIFTIYRIARYYYSDGLSQEEIAAKEGFSRSQISRLIDLAKNLGLVKITLLPPTDQHTEDLSCFLMKELKLHSAIVVPVSKNADDGEITMAIATRAADYLMTELSKYSVVGLGWGRTVYKTAGILPHAKAKGEKPFFVPLIGISGDDNPYLQINTIIDRFSSSFQSKGFFVNLPCVREKGAALTEIEEKRISDLKKRWVTIEAAVIGLGAPPSKSPNLIDELSPEYKNELRRSPACGDILAQFFNPDGNLFKPEHDYDLLAYNIKNLSGLKKSICLAGGSEKYKGILTAARAGYITDLISDEKTALSIVKLMQSDSQTGMQFEAEKIVKEAHRI
ncbi:MAG: sugar-binding transcriptional regulator [Spirochaetota bacterium]